MSDPVAALLELCELHYCPAEKSDSVGKAFLESRGWAFEAEKTDAGQCVATFYWWVKDGRRLSNSEVLFEVGREVFEAAKNELAIDRPPAHGTISVRR